MITHNRKLVELIFLHYNFQHMNINEILHVFCYLYRMTLLSAHFS